MPKIFDLADESAQLAFGAQLAYACEKQIRASCVIFLQGELGAGKTTLARGFLRGLGYAGKVKSPTYALVERYEWPEKPLVVLHADLYRLEDAHDIRPLGLTDEMTAGEPAVILLIEWPEKADKQLPAPDLTCYISPLSCARRISLRADTPQGEEILAVMT